MADKIEKQLAKAIDDMTPDIYNKVLEQPDIKMEEPDVFFREPVSRKKRRYKAVYAAASLAAMLCLVCGLGWYQLLDTESTIGLDVNPSLEFSVNRQNRVTKVNVYNKDAKIVTESLDLKNVEIHTAVSAVLGSMLQHGYLTEEQNAVLLTVQNPDGKKAEELKEELLKNINAVLEGNGTDGRIVSQIVDEDKDLEKLSDSNHVSCGKMKLIQNILSKDNNHTVEELNRMSIQELMELVGGENIDLHGHMEYDEQDFCKGDSSEENMDKGSQGNGNHHSGKQKRHHGENSHE